MRLSLILGSLLLTACNAQDTRLKISWQPVSAANPFSTTIVEYEIWNNDHHLDTTKATSYELPIDLASSEPVCVRIRAVSGEQHSGFSDPSCY